MNIPNPFTVETIAKFGETAAELTVGTLVAAMKPGGVGLALSQVAGKAAGYVVGKVVRGVPEAYRKTADVVGSYARDLREIILELPGSMPRAKGVPAMNL